MSMVSMVSFCAEKINNLIKKLDTFDIIPADVKTLLINRRDEDKVMFVGTIVAMILKKMDENGTKASKESWKKLMESELELLQQKEDPTAIPVDVNSVAYGIAERYVNLSGIDRDILVEILWNYLVCFADIFYGAKLCGEEELEAKSCKGKEKVED